MGEEHDEPNPFQFFTDHVDPFIADATREGRKREFETFAAFAGEEVPDPQDPATFELSKLDPTCGDPHLRDFYCELLRLRRGLPREVEADVAGRVLRLRRGPAVITVDFDELRVSVSRAA